MLSAFLALAGIGSSSLALAGCIVLPLFQRLDLVLSGSEEEPS